jgi:purine-nucleoside phosphorylase
MRAADEEESLLRQMKDWGANVGIILGSGLNALVATSPGSKPIPYSRFAEIPPISVPGHIGQFVLGNLGNAKVVFAQGRVHLYEGRSAREITAIVRVLARAGIRILILTNAAGSLNRSFEPGHWMMLRDHINLTGTSSLVGAPAFTDMTEAYSLRLRQAFSRAAADLKQPLHEGVYAGLLGPQYETPAEVRMLQQLGADAVGMSTVQETIQARALGMEVAGFSCLTNFGAGISAAKLDHEEVLQTGQTSAKAFGQLLTAAVPSL